MLDIDAEKYEIGLNPYYNGKYSMSIISCADEYTDGKS